MHLEIIQLYQGGGGGGGGVNTLTSVLHNFYAGERTLREKVHEAIACHAFTPPTHPPIYLSCKKGEGINLILLAATDSAREAKE